MKVHVRRTQWAVGHGGFHSGIIRSDDGQSEISWMYDCGTSSSGNSLTAELKTFKSRTSYFSKTFSTDYLFISHFHEDHVGGLGRLHKANFKAARIFAPLLDPLERILAFASGDEPSDPIDLDFYLGLIADPESTLSQISDSITFVIPGAGGAQRPDAESEEEGPKDPGDTNFTGSPMPANSNTSATCSDAASTITTDSGRPIWVFEPYVLKQLTGDKVLKSFKKELAVALGTTHGKLTNKLASSTSILDLIKSGPNRAKMRLAYEAVLRSQGLERDLNLTSLCLYAGPISKVSRTWRSRWPLRDITSEDQNDWVDRREVGAWTLKAGWLHTGDASLKHRGRCAEFLSFYKVRLHSVGAFLLPHHGSDFSFDSNLLAAMKSHPVCLVASKPGHRKNWVHPGQEVIGAVSANGNHLVVISDTIDSRYTDTLTLEV